MNKRKLLSSVSAVLAASMLFTITGCQSGGSGTSGSSASTSSASSSAASTAASTASSSAEPSSTLIFDQPTTLTMLATEWTGITVGNDMPVYQELEKRTNVHLEFTLLPTDGTLDKFNLIMASGDLPDIIGYANMEALLKYGMQGALIPLEDLINENAPNIVKVLNNPLEGEELPYSMNTWAQLTASDGHMYVLPLFSCQNAIGAVYAMRTDWLKKLSLNVPTTSEELYNVLKAFKEQDPNGNGEADEIPFASGAGGKTATILPVINAFDAHMDLYIDSADDTIKYGPVEQQYKDGLAFLNRLYTEGLLEEDYLTATYDQWLSRTANSQTGFMFVWPSGGIGTANNGLQKVNTEYKFEPIAPLKSPSGRQYKDTFAAGNYMVGREAITVSNKYPVETMRYFDYCFSEEGTMLSNYGVEGLDYTLENGEPVFTDRILKNPGGKDPEIAAISDGINWTALPYQVGWGPGIQEKKDAAPWTVEAWDLYKKPGMVEAPMPTFQYSSADLAKKSQLVTEINTYKDAMIDKFIMGVEPLDKFDEFVQNINKAGLPELLELMNNAYTAYKANMK